MKRLCVIGDPVGHSLSPRLFAEIGRAAGAALDYRAVTVTAAELPAFMDEAKRGSWDGCNVTMPLKQAILPLLDARTETATKLGAVNTVRFEHGSAVGHNTDGAGYLRSLRRAGFSPCGKRVTVLGAGGAARAAALALAEASAEVRVLNRSKEHAMQLAALHENIRVSDVSALEDADLLINATPRGMTVPWESLDFLRALPKSALVSDMVYFPEITPLLKEASMLGHPTLGGFGMLCAQAVASAEFFFDRTFPGEELLKTLLDLQRENG